MADPRETDPARAVAGGLVPPEFLADSLDDDTRRRRNRMIFRLRANDQSPATIAEMFDLKERQVREIVEGYRAEERADMLDTEAAREAVANALDGFEESMEQVARIAASSPQDANRLGAIRLRLELHRARLELLGNIGALSLRQMRAEVDLDQAARAVLDTLEEHGVAPEVQLAVVEAVERASGATEGSDGARAELLPPEGAAA